MVNPSNTRSTNTPGAVSQQAYNSVLRVAGPCPDPQGSYCDYAARTCLNYTLPFLLPWTSPTLSDLPHHMAQDAVLLALEAGTARRDLS